MEKYLTYYACDGNFKGAAVDGTVAGFLGKHYLSGLFNEGDYFEVTADIPQDGFYRITLRYFENETNKFIHFLIDDYCYSNIKLPKVEEFTEVPLCSTRLKKGKHSLKLLKSWASNYHIDCFRVYPEKESEFKQPSFELCNPDAITECKSVMNYFKTIYGKRMLTGQHTNLARGVEIDYICNITGKHPAIRGFDLLSYSLTTDTDEPSDHKIYETRNNENSIEEIIRWVKENKGIATVCWHWYSPVRGKDKSFYTKFTEFDLNSALTEGTPENAALLRDMDQIGRELLKLKALNIPILWRPLHEASGGWFWWGAKGPEAYKKLYRLMYKRFTCDLKLNNLIWVWNAPDPEWYVGDEYCDIASIDIYNPTHNYGPSKGEFDLMRDIVKGNKPVALAENYPIPDPGVLIDSGTYWLYYMTWSSEQEEAFLEQNPPEHYKAVYGHPHAVTLEELPDLYAGEEEKS